MVIIRKNRRFSLQAEGVGVMPISSRLRSLREAGDVLGAADNRKLRRTRVVRGFVPSASVVVLYSAPSLLTDTASPTAAYPHSVVLAFCVVP
jgi:hypothetical protein